MLLYAGRTNWHVGINLSVNFLYAQKINAKLITNILSLCFRKLPVSLNSFFAQRIKLYFPMERGGKVPLQICDAQILLWLEVTVNLRPNTYETEKYWENKRIRLNVTWMRIVLLSLIQLYTSFGISYELLRTQLKTSVSNFWRRHLNF